MSKKSNETEIKLHVTDYIDKAFKPLPTNSFIHKGRCGIGGTHLELKTDRNSIIVVPTKGIITDKINSTDENGKIEYPNLFPVLGGVKIEDISTYLLKDIPFKKIIVTPDSLHKIIEASESIDMLNKLYSHYYLFLDEAHSIVTESFREAMIKAFELHFQFENRIIISATPYYFTDPRMQDLNYYRIIFDEPLGKIGIVNTKYIKCCVNAILTEEVKTKANVHIFYNSVTEIAEAIELAKLEDCNVHCSEKEENLEKIGKFFKPQPIRGEYKKFNFYTTSHFEGWNLEDIEPTIILVTDVYKLHTKVGISNKGVQAVGRQRVKKDRPETKPFQIYHITNHRNMNTYKSLEEIKNKYLFEGKWETESYNKYIQACKLYNIESDEARKKQAEKYTVINLETGLSELCHGKVDQFINESICNEEFNHIDFIKEAWERAGFETEICPYNQSIEKQIQRKTRKSVKEILSDLEILDPKNQSFFHSDNDADRFTKLKSDYPVLYEAYQNLTDKEIESTEYKAKEIEKLLILKNNKDAEMRVLKLLPLYFKVGNRYTKEKIKIGLQEIYDKSSFQKKATSEQLEAMEWYETKPCKIKNKDGKSENGFEILRMKFKMTVSTK